MNDRPQSTIPTTLAALAIVLTLFPSCSNEPPADGGASAPALVNDAAAEPVTADGLPVPGDSNQWRGPQRDGHVAAALPEPLPATLAEAWRVEVGEGHATPVIGGDRAFVFTREGDDEVARSVSLADGAVQWRQADPVPYEMNADARGHGKGPKATPLLHDGRLYTFGIAGALTCRRASDGKLLWRRSNADFGATSPLYGTASSPVLDGDRLVAQIGGPERGAVRAFDRLTGEVSWSWDADGPAYASPIVAEVGGRRQVVTLTGRHVVGLAADSGQLLWKVPFTTPYEQNVVTPTIHGDRVIVSGYDQGTTALAPGDGGAEPVWTTKKVSMYMSSPVLVGDRLFAMSHKKKGQLVGLDATSGAVLWQGPGKLGENASLVVAGNRVWALTEGARLLALDPAAEAYDVEAEYEVATSPTWAHPVFIDGAVLIKSKTSLARLNPGT